MILGDNSQTDAAVPTQLSIEAAGSSRYVNQRPIEEGWNNLLEKTVISQVLGTTFCLLAVWKTGKSSIEKLRNKILLQKLEREKDRIDLSFLLTLPLWYS